MFVLESYQQTEKQNGNKQFFFSKYPPGEPALCKLPVAINYSWMNWIAWLWVLGIQWPFGGVVTTLFLKSICLHSPLGRKVIWKPKTGHRNRRGGTWQKPGTQLCICFGMKSWVYLSLWDLIKDMFLKSPRNPSFDTDTRSRLLPSVGSCRPVQCTCWQIQIGKFNMIIPIFPPIY